MQFPIQHEAVDADQLAYETDMAVLHHSCLRKITPADATTTMMNMDHHINLNKYEECRLEMQLWDASG